MSDTLGNIIDKLTTTGLKMWNRQDFVYKIRKMSWEEFYTRCWQEDNFLKEFYDSLQNATDLNVQRNQLMQEFDETIVRMISDAVAGKELDDGKNIQRHHKQY
jgi:hypothetical protein